MNSLIENCKNCFGKIPIKFISEFENNEKIIFWV
jgi:hypothetical protein